MIQGLHVLLTTDCAHKLFTIVCQALRCYSYQMELTRIGRYIVECKHTIMQAIRWVSKSFKKSVMETLTLLLKYTWNRNKSFCNVSRWIWETLLYRHYQSNYSSTKSNVWKGVAGSYPRSEWQWGCWWHSCPASGSISHQRETCLQFDSTQKRCRRV